MREACLPIPDGALVRSRSRTAEASRVTTEDLPPSDTSRWVVRRKAQVVHGVRAGVISLAEACRRYNLSVEEFETWERLIDEHGMRGLRVTRLKEYRGKGRGKRR